MEEPFGVGGGEGEVAAEGGEVAFGDGGTDGVEFFLQAGCFWAGVEGRGGKAAEDYI